MSGMSKRQELMITWNKISCSHHSNDFELIAISAVLVLVLFYGMNPAQPWLCSLVGAAFPQYVNSAPDHSVIDIKTYMGGLPSFILHHFCKVASALKVWYGVAVVINAVLVSVLLEYVNPVQLDCGFIGCSAAIVHKLWHRSHSH